MILYLFRHGIAVDPADPTCPADPDRPLTRKGIEKTREVAQGLRELGVRPDTMISSPFLRAAQTAEIACEALGFPRDKIRRTDALKPNGSPAELFKELSHVRGHEVMCFGHAPNMDEIIAHALGTRGAVTELKKAGVACLDVEGFSPARARLMWLFPPKVLRQLGS
ncbi:MAG: phosphohistidine phosphatase SixA [Candidatus Acidiferrales bacterium]